MRFVWSTDSELVAIKYDLVDPSNGRAGQYGEFQLRYILDLASEDVRKVTRSHELVDMGLPSFAPVGNVLCIPWRDGAQGVTLELCQPGSWEGVASMLICTAMPSHLMGSHSRLLYPTACTFTAWKAPCSTC